MGITWWQFWGLNPHKIKIIAIGYNEQKIEFDAMMHAWWGSYGLSAVSVAVEHCLAGKKAKSSYIEKPILSDMQETKQKTKEEVHLTEEEKRKQTEQLFMRLKIMGANHKRNNKSKGSTVS